MPTHKKPKANKQKTIAQSATIKRLGTLQKIIKRLLVALTVALCLFAGGFFIPDTFINPVKDAKVGDWHPKSFWYYPWGKSGVHRGVDIFAPVGRPVLSATDGVVISTAILKLGGKTVTVLGPKWRIHYYAHLDDVSVHTGQWLKRGDPIARVGTTGNAYGKAPHLHYSIRTLVPYLWLRDDAPYGNQKIWYIDPTPRL